MRDRERELYLFEGGSSGLKKHVEYLGENFQPLILIRADNHVQSFSQAEGTS